MGRINELISEGIRKGVQTGKFRRANIGAKAALKEKLQIITAACSEWAYNMFGMWRCIPSYYPNY